MGTPEIRNTGLPMVARVVENLQETPSIFTLTLELADADDAGYYKFQPGQFNMLTVPGVGEAAISIVSDPEKPGLLEHTIRKLGRVTGCLERLQPGDFLGLRGPFGNGWPVSQVTGKDVLIVTGGLGCAPVVSVINYVRARRQDYGRLTIIQGVKHADDLLWRERYERWAAEDSNRVLLAADVGGAHWPWHVGLVTELLDQVGLEIDNTAALMCGPEPMMLAAARKLSTQGLADDAIWLSLERNMQCAIGLCGHCQFGPQFVCRDGPVLPYRQLRDLLGRRGF